MFGLAVVISLLILGYITGSYFEASHYKSIVERERKFKHLPVITGEWKTKITDDYEGTVFGSGVVIGSDYFKTFVSQLRSIVGGRLTAYESLIDRGRREAILRMIEKADKWGAEKIVNLRIETSNINSASGKKGMPCVEVFAYATALKKKNA